jgi:hypothetical protein
MVTPPDVTSTPATKVPRASGPPDDELPRIVPRRRVGRWFNIGALYPTLGLGIPFGPQFLTVKTVNLLGPTLTAVIGLTLHESAYAAEVVRGGILSVDSGQTEAAQALGLSRRRTLWYIAVTTVLSAGQFYVERYYARGNSRALPPTPLQRLRGHLTAVRLRLSAATASDARPAIGGDR